MSDIPEHELIRQVRDGSNAACELLFRRYERPAYRLCLCVTVSGGRSAGVPQEGLLQLYRRIDTFRAGCRHQGLLRRFVNKVLRLRGPGLRFARDRSRAEISSWTVKRRTVLTRTW